MCAERYARPGGIKPGSLAVAVGINALVLTALALSSPELRDKVAPTRLKIVPVFETPPPKPDVPKPQAKRAEVMPKLSPVRPDPTPKLTDVFVRDPVYVDPGPPLTDLGTLTGAGTGPVVNMPKPIPPVFHGSEIDPRYLRDFQPDYPAGERRLEREGVVHVRVLIGVDGA